MRILPFQARKGDEAHRAATPLELFFDLVCVVAIAAATATFHHEISYGHSAEFLIPYLLGVVSVWWIWANFTWFASSYDNDDAIYRILIFVMIGGFTIYAGGISYVLENSDARMGVLGWIIMRAALVALWLRAAIANPDYRQSALIYAAGLTILQVLWFIGFFIFDLSLSGFYWVGALLMIGEFLVPYFASRFNHPPLHRHHMVERHGLLNIIVLGEIILAAALFFEELHGAEFNVPLALGGGVTVAIVCMIWVYYFIEDDHLEAIGTGPHFAWWGYLHIFVFASAALFGSASAAQLDVLTDHSKASPAMLAALTNGAIAFYILGIWLIRDRFIEHRIAYWVSLLAPIGFAAIAVLQLPYWVSAVALALALMMRVSMTTTKDELQKS